MPNRKFKLLRENLHVQLYFNRPLFKWSELPLRFFDMIYTLLGQRLNIQPGEFSTFPTNSLGEAKAKFNVYGGASTVSLLADRITFDFPGLTSSDMPVVHEIMGSVHDGFQKFFPEVEQGRVEVQNYAHLDIGSQEAVADLLGAFQVQNVVNSFDSESVLNVPAVKFTVVSKDASWQCVVLIEQSQLNTSAVFTSVVTSLLKRSPTPTYIEKANFVADVTRRCLAVVNLEGENAAT